MHPFIILFVPPPLAEDDQDGKSNITLWAAVTSDQQLVQSWVSFKMNSLHS